MKQPLDLPDESLKEKKTGPSSLESFKSNEDSVVKHNNKRYESLVQKFKLVLYGTVLCGLVQLMISYKSSSFSCINDAIHQVIDSFSFLICLIAVKISQKIMFNRRSEKESQIELIGAFVCNSILFVLMGVLLVQSIQKIIFYKNSDWKVEETQVNASMMIYCSCIGLLCNFFIVHLLKTKRGFKGLV